LEWLSLALAGGGLVGCAVLGNVLVRVGWEADAARSAVHLLVGLLVAAAPLYFSNPAPLYVLAIGFTLANGWSWWRGWFPGMHAARPSSLGTVLFPLAVVPTTLVTWSADPARLPAFVAAFLVLAVADPVASYVGRGEGRKTLRGSIAFALTASALTLGLLLYAEAGPVTAVLAAALAVAAAATAAEALGTEGWDNLLIPLAVVGVLVPWMGNESTLFVLWAVIAGIAFGALAYAGRALNEQGALAGGLMAASFVLWGDVTWIVPALTFFVLSSALSFVRRSTKSNLEARVAKEGTRRDAVQVLANGGVAWLLLGATLLAPGALLAAGSADEHTLYVAFLGAVAAAAADTWGTELGTAGVARPWSLRTGKRVPPGTSGAISPVGTLATLLGAFSVAGAALAVGGISMAMTVVVVAAGCAGSLVDSLVGATLQARYQNPITGELTERRPRPADRPVRGLAAIDNDVVNAIATAAGATVAVLLKMWA